MRPESWISTGLGLSGLVALSALVFSQHARARAGQDGATLETEALRAQVQLLRRAVEELNAHAMDSCAHDTSHPDPMMAPERYAVWHRLLSDGPLSQVVPPLRIHDPLHGTATVGSAP